MSQNTEQPDQPLTQPAPLWRPAGVVFLAVSLGALAVGAVPEFILPLHQVQAMPAPPALPMLLAAQAAFILLLCPLLSRPAAPAVLIGRNAAEHLVWLAAGIPLYIVAGWLSDATAWDVLRGAAYLTAVAAAGWGLGVWAGLGRSWVITAVGILVAVAAVAAPAGCYLVAELRGWSAGLDSVLWATPATCAWRLAGSGAAAPWWAWALWPAVGLMAVLCRLLIAPARR